MGRTQLQDAVPMTLGQEFEAFAATLEEDISKLNNNANLFVEVNMGATAIGTGINAPVGYATLVRKFSAVNRFSCCFSAGSGGSYTGYRFLCDLFIRNEASCCETIKNLQRFKIASSGPRAGLSEINLPPMQPGSSIMPGKVNPVIPEVVNQVCFKVFGNDLTVTFAAEAGQLQLNVMEPVLSHAIMENIHFLSNALIRFVKNVSSELQQIKKSA
jgi:aspartate ammonia-lyase